MRDIILTAFVAILLPKVLSRPHVGILLWYFLGFMNPQSLCWGFARDIPYSEVTAVVLLTGLLFSKEPKRLEFMTTNTLLLVYIVWMFITTLYAFNPDLAFALWGRMWRIQLITFVTMMVMTTPERINQLVWVMALSVGFYGFKGGLFTLLTGGAGRVWGPEQSFIGDNNALGLALCMTIPLLRYLQLVSTHYYVNQGLRLVMLLSMAAILGTSSRGALLAMGAMVMFLVYKSRKKFLLTLIMFLAVSFLLSIMPSSWYARMDTIRNYEYDASAMSRLNCWGTAWNLALNHVTGGGFKGLPIPWVFREYASNPVDIHDAHSIYFQVLAEHGFIGFGLFLSLGASAWFLASSMMRLAKGNEELEWIYDLCSMIQVSLVGYATAGAFLGLADFDYYYALIALLVCCKTFMLRYQQGRKKAYGDGGDTQAVVKKTMAARNFIQPVGHVQE